MRRKFVAFDPRSGLGEQVLDQGRRRNVRLPETLAVKVVPHRGDGFYRDPAGNGRLIPDERCKPDAECVRERF